MNNKTNVLILIVFIFVLVIFLLIIQYFHNTVESDIQNNLITPKSSVTDPPLPTIIPILDTSNWKTYQNTLYGYTLKYPSQFWNISVLKTETPKNSYAPYFQHLCNYNISCGGISFYTKQDRYSPTTKLEDYFLILDLDHVISRNYITIDGERAYQVQFVRNLPNSKTENYIYVIHNQKIYQINIWLDYSKDNSLLLSNEITYDKQFGDNLDYQKVVDTMIQSIKFTN